MSSKLYVIVTRSFKANKLHTIIRKFTINCMGGEKEMSEKPKMVFVDLTAIPSKTGRGRKGKDWLALLEQIPENKAWQISENNKEDIKLSSLKMAITKINKEAGKTLYNAWQRTIEDTKFLFVCRVKETPLEKKKVK